MRAKEAEVPEAAEQPPEHADEEQQPRSGLRVAQFVLAMREDERTR